MSLEYGNPAIFVTENGVGTSVAEIDDEDRVQFFKAYIDETLKGGFLSTVKMGNKFSCKKL